MWWRERFKKKTNNGKNCKNFCNKIYVTDDNPRKENPKKLEEK